MVFSSTVFLFLFLPVLLIFYYAPAFVLRRECRPAGTNMFAPASYRVYKNFILLLSSLFFYAWGEPVFIFIMLISIIINWFIALIIENSKKLKKFWLVIAVSFDVLLLFIFKYASFISKNLALITGNDDVIINIALPIGISFFTFQMMSYIFDVYYETSQAQPARRERLKAQKNPCYVALYISLFPQLIAGPIVRYNQIENDILVRHENFDNFASGTRRFIYGLAKKVLIANFVAQIADNIFDYTPNPSVLTAWLGAVAYTLQIYFDFSGYSDMAIGLGRMFGFNFTENFNYPYIAASIRDFWHRWHISLSTWFRDYVYIPLGGNRVKRSRWILNIFIVWLLTGIWHGANWTFILWGLIYFVFLFIEHETNFDKKLGALSHVYAMLIVILAWVFFRSKDVTSGVNYIFYMFGLKQNNFYDSGFIEYIKGSWVVLIIALAGIFPIVPKIHEFILKKNYVLLAWLEQIWLIIIFLVSVLEVVSSTYNPFIYFNF